MDKLNNNNLLYRIPQVSELDQQRRELYRRYGLEGYALSSQCSHLSVSHNRNYSTSLGSIQCSLPPGALPHSNPMSLFPMDVFPTGNEPEIPEALRPALRAHRAYVQQCLMAVRLRRALPIPRGLLRRPASSAPVAGAALAPIPMVRAMLSNLDSMSISTVRLVCENCFMAIVDYF